jgi:hypothetical protein
MEPVDQPHPTPIINRGLNQQDLSFTELMDQQEIGSMELTDHLTIMPTSTLCDTSSMELSPTLVEETSRTIIPSTSSMELADQG